MLGGSLSLFLEGASLNIYMETLFIFLRRHIKKERGEIYFSALTLNLLSRSCLCVLINH